MSSSTRKHDKIIDSELEENPEGVNLVTTTDEESYDGQDKEKITGYIHSQQELTREEQELYGAPEQIRLNSDEHETTIWQDCFTEKMNKIYKLLEFYHKNKTMIKFRLQDNSSIELKGTIIGISNGEMIGYISRGHEYVTLKQEDTPEVKIFLEDIDITTLIPNAIRVTPDIRFKRTTLPPSRRFQVLSRDKNICQYCGRQPPEVELEVDHIQPVSKGGIDELSNLITSCRDCNRGKSNKELS